MTVRIELKNIKSVMDDLEEVESEMKKRIMQDSIMDAAKIVQRAARALAPQKTGALRRSIRLRKMKKRERGDMFGAVVDFNSKTAGYTHIVEGGAAGHLIKPEKGKALKLKGGYVSKVNHPGFRARNFLANAWRTTQHKLVDEIRKGILLRVAKLKANRG